jgi:hypothetical protein
MKRPVLWLCIALSSLTLGCSEDEEPWGPAWTSSHFVYRARPDDEMACASILEPLEAHAALLSEFYDDFSLLYPVEYFKYRDEADLKSESPCYPEMAACAYGLTIHSVENLHEHELIHAYESWGGAPPLLSEGLAVALSCDSRWAPFSDQPDWRDLLDPSSVLSTDGYLSAGAFVTRLIEEHGISNLRLFSRDSAGSPTDPDHVARAFEATYGYDLDSAWKEYDWHSTKPCIPIWTCAAREAEVGETVELSTRCDAFAVNRRLPDRSAVRVQVIDDGANNEVPTTSVFGSRSSRMIHQTCAGERFTAQEPGKWLSYGEHWFAHSAEVVVAVGTELEQLGGSVSGSFTVDEFPGVFVDSCDQATPASPPERSQWHLPSSALPSFVRLGPDPARVSMIAEYAEQSPELAIGLCSACEDGRALNCTPIEMSFKTFGFDVLGGEWLEIHWTSSYGARLLLHVELERS